MVSDRVPVRRPRGLPMLPGPVFNFELLSTSRRGRFYTVRAFYAIGPLDYSLGDPFGLVVGL